MLLCSFIRVEHSKIREEHLFVLVYCEKKNARIIKLKTTIDVEQNVHICLAVILFEALCTADSLDLIVANDYPNQLSCLCQYNLVGDHEIQDDWDCIDSFDSPVLLFQQLAIIYPMASK